VRKKHGERFGVPKSFSRLLDHPLIRLKNVIRKRFFRVKMQRTCHKDMSRCETRDTDENDTLALVSKPDLRYDDLKGMMLMTAKENASKSIAGAKTHLFFWYAVVFSVPVFSAAYTLIFGWKAESLTAPLAFLSVFVYFSGERGKHLLAAAAGALTLFLPRILVALWVAL